MKDDLLDNRAVVERRQPKTADELDFFPTPPWATRALTERLAIHCPELDQMMAWEPASGAGHMVGPLAEAFGTVFASDVFDHRKGRPTPEWDFLTDGKHLRFKADWIITNPPFNLGIDFALKAIERAERGVALLVRTAFLEGGTRFERLFKPHPPTLIYQFSERVPMVRGRCLRRKEDGTKQSTATSYCWIVWGRDFDTYGKPLLRWIEPGTRARLERWGDYDDDKAVLL